MAGETIHAFLHCKKCLDEWTAEGPETAGKSPMTYAALSVGFTPKGLQVICYRHDLNVIHIDFETMKHPADLSPEGNFGNPIPRKDN